MDNKHCASYALPPSMTKQSNFEDVPFSKPGRAAQTWLAQKALKGMRVATPSLNWITLSSTFGHATGILPPLLVFLTSFMWSLRLRERHHFSTKSSVLPFICDCYEQHWGNPHGSVSCAPTSSELRHYGAFDGTHCSADVCCGGFKRTCDQKLSSGLLLKFTSPLPIPFR